MVTAACLCISHVCSIKNGHACGYPKKCQPPSGSDCIIGQTVFLYDKERLSNKYVDVVNKCTKLTKYHVLFMCLEMFLSNS